MLPKLCWEGFEDAGAVCRRTRGAVGGASRLLGTRLIPFGGFCRHLDYSSICLVGPWIIIAETVTNDDVSSAGRILGLTRLPLFSFQLLSYQGPFEIKIREFEKIRDDFHYILIY